MEASQQDPNQPVQTGQQDPNQPVQTGQQDQPQQDPNQADVENGTQDQTQADVAPSGQPAEGAAGQVGPSGQPAEGTTSGQFPTNAEQEAQEAQRQSELQAQRDEHNARTAGEQPAPQEDQA